VISPVCATKFPLASPTRAISLESDLSLVIPTGRATQTFAEKESDKFLGRKSCNFSLVSPTETSSLRHRANLENKMVQFSSNAASTLQFSKSESYKKGETQKSDHQSSGLRVLRPEMQSPFQKLPTPLETFRLGNAPRKRARLIIADEGVTIKASSHLKRRAINNTVVAPVAEYERCNTEVVPGKIHLGTLSDANSKSFRANNSITAILTVMAKPLSTGITAKLKYMHIAADDNVHQDLSQYFEEAADFIEKEKTVLVHCHAGISRSTTICAAYLIRKHGWSLGKTLEFIRQRRSCASPNFSFLGQLEAFAKQYACSK